MPYRKQIVGKYELGKVLASGYFDCRTRLCTHIVTGAQYVVRIYDKSVLAEAQWMWDRTRDAIHVMRTLPKHENLIETLECFETQTSLYILMQLFAPMHITKMYTTDTPTGRRVQIPIPQTKKYYAQVIRGLLHMHNHGVVHLGLAPDHIMVNDRDHVKIGYLVSCTYFQKGQLCHDLRGTTHTVAPEVLQNEGYDPYLADAWSMGVLLYFMLNNGQYPHDGANTTKNIIYNRIRPPDPSLPPEAKDLLARLLNPRPSRRMRVEDIMSHPFFAEASSDAEGRGSIRSTVSAPETSFGRDPSTGEDTVNIRIPYGLSRQEEAAYIIQHTYRAYLARKRQQLSGGKSTSEKPMAEKSFSTGCRLPPKQGAANRTLKAFNETGDVHEFVSPRVEKRQGRVEAAPFAPDMPVFDDPSIGTPTSNQLFTEGDDSLALLSEGGDSLAMSPGPSLIEETINPQTAAYKSGGQRNNTKNITSPKKGGNGRVMKASFVLGPELDGRANEKNPENLANLLSNIKVDATRPCPVCHRMPMQRLAGHAPYLNTPFEYKEGEFALKVEES